MGVLALISLAAGADPVTSVLLQYGVLGVGVLVMGYWIRQQSTHMQNLYESRIADVQKMADKERERADRNEEALGELNRALQERAVPAIVEMVGTVRVLLPLVTELQSELRRKQ